jgi:hypothetical protein
MRSRTGSGMLKTAVLTTAILLLAASASVAQTVNLTAQRTSTTLSDGNNVPMWGYVCGTVSGAGYNCALLNSGLTGWAPPLITVPYTANASGASTTNLQITLTNNLPVPTSLVIVGQLGGNLGGPVKVPGPIHAGQNQTTWPSNATATFTPPAQANRARSFVPEAAPAAFANGVMSAAGSQAYSWTGLKPGTYLLMTGTRPSIQGPMGLYGVVVVTQAPVSGASLAAGLAYPGVKYDADATMLLSDVDPVQNGLVNSVAAKMVASTTALTASAVEAIETAPWNPSCTLSASCYPPAVDYNPRYSLVNGQSYDKMAVSKSTIQLPAVSSSGNILVRLVNASPRMHVPSIVGLPMWLIAEDGNLQPEIQVAAAANKTAMPKLQNEVFLPAGKVFDVAVMPASSGGAYTAATYPVFDRQLSLSANNQPNSGMQAYLQIGAGGQATTGGAVSQGGANFSAPASLQPVAAKANNDTYSIGQNLAVFSNNVLTNDAGVSVASLGTAPKFGTVVMSPNGNFTYTPNGPYIVADSFTYFGNGNSANPNLTATVTISLNSNALAPNAVADSFASNVATVLKVAGPGVLANDSDPANYALTAAFIAGSATTGLSVTLNANGSFTAVVPGPGQYQFQYNAVNANGVQSAKPAIVTLTFAAGSGLAVTVQDAQAPTTKIADYRWVIEEDKTFHLIPGVSTGPNTPILGTNFHRSAMPMVAQGCTGTISCGSGQTVYNPTTTLHDPVAARPQSTPDLVNLPASNPDGTPRYYYLSVLPGDAAAAVVTPLTPAGHTMGGVLISPVCTNKGTVDPATSKCSTAWALPANATVLVEPNPLPVAQLSVFVFEDNNPTNGDVDGVEEQQGLGDFEIVLNDVAAATGDPTGQMTYDEFNMPLTNALIGQPGCPDIHNPGTATPDGNGGKIVGVIYTCPEPSAAEIAAANTAAKRAALDAKYALRGHALIKNLFPNRFDVIANPGAAREAAGETWYQTSTLEGTRPQDAFAKAGEPPYFQEFGPPGFHSFIGFINPDRIKSANKALGGTNTVTGRVTMEHMSRPTNVTLWDSKSNATLAQTTCYVGLNSAGGDGENIAFAKCDQDGNFTLTGVPAGSYQAVVWDQWLDTIISYTNVTVPAPVPPLTATTVSTGDIPVLSWFTHVQTSIFIDKNQDGIRNGDDEPVGQVPVRLRFRDGSISNTLLTDNDGKAVFHELFPLFNWYVAESDDTRFRNTGVHIVVDGGGAVDPVGHVTPDGTPTGGILNSTYPPYIGNTGRGLVSTERVDKGVDTEGVQGFVSQTQILDFGKIPYATGENGGIRGTVAFASTRPFDDPGIGIQNVWEPLVPNVTVNLYQETTATDGTPVLTLIDHTQTSSWDDWVNRKGVYANLAPMSCPGQDPADPYVTYTLGGNLSKCYDGFHNWNQVQPAVYDGLYNFPSATYPTAATTGTNCTTCTVNAATGKPMLPAGKYVTEVVVPSGYEIVKEEDKNILIGDTFIAPAVSQFGGLSNIFILPDQAAINAYNASNPNNPTTNLGRGSFTEFGPGALINLSAPCVGSARIVPDYLSLYPQAQQVAPFAGATRNLCDRREVVLESQMQATANFFIFNPTPIAGHFTGMILDDASAEFNALAPDFGEKFGVPFVPVSFKDFNGVEIQRTYSDQFGMFNGVTFSTWMVNPPNPTGYAPNMMITCMNDPGPIPDPNNPGKFITDPMYNPSYSNFCYTNPFMPGRTDYLDTPVLPIAAFASGFNPPDCAYPDATPAIKSVAGDVFSSGANLNVSGPWVSGTGAGHRLTITALGDVTVPNNAYLGPAAQSGLASQKTITRHYGFGAAKGTVSINGREVPPASITTWTDSQIVLTVPGGATTGELVITAANGKQSIDSVTVTIEAATPTYVAPTATPSASGFPTPIQDAIDAAKPGALIILGPGTYPELVIMWKPVRLQGVGAASVIINAAKYPTHKLDVWRTRINQLFGVDPITGNVIGNPQIDPLPGQEITGGIILLEPSVLGTEEGAGITVLAANPPNNGADVCNPNSRNYSQSYFTCADDSTARNHVAHARIDGLSVTGGDAGGGIYVNGWAHYLEIANNRIYGNAGTFNGGVRIGVPYLELTSLPQNCEQQGDNQGCGFGFDINVDIHHNAITKNGTVEGPGAGSAGDAGGAGGGVSICTGTDGYSIDHNWICGNYSTSDGAGIGHIGLSQNGLIAKNSILFNQSFVQTDPTHGGGIVVIGEPSLTGGLSLGTGNVTIDANLIQGNFAEGHGGGIRLEDVNGADVAANPRDTTKWNVVKVINNMITNNEAGWSGGGISLADTLVSQIVNNTVASNDSTSIAGPLLPGSIVPNDTGGTPIKGNPNPAGISSEPTSPALLAAIPRNFSLPAPHLKTLSSPDLANNIVWKNRSFFFDARTGVDRLCSSNNAGAPGCTVLADQAVTGQCPSGAAYWDLGVLGDTSVTPGALKLNPTYSVITSTTGYGGANNTQTDPQLVSLYCNGSRPTPELGHVINPPTPFNLQVNAVLDEGNNYVTLRYGPLSLFNPSSNVQLGNYTLATGSPAINSVSCTAPQGGRLAPNHDFFGNSRPFPSCSANPNAFDRGAQEYPNPRP